MVRSIVAAGVVAVVACSSGGSPKGRAAARCADVATCTAVCAPCRTGRCSESQGRACRELGKLHLRGQPPQFDLAAAASAYEAGCNGYAPACAALALQVQDGRGVPYDADKARALYTRACDDGAGVGCFNVGVMYEGGVGVPHDEARARELFAQAERLYRAECEADPSWCPNLGYLYENGLVGDTKDPARAVPVYRAACERGDLDSCTSLALLEVDGLGLPADRPGGLARLDRACKAGGALACGALAQERDPDRRDIPGTLPLYEHACDGGIAPACASAAAAYLLGDGILADTPRGEALADRACDLGSSNACWLRGQFLADTDPAAATPFLVRACHIGLPEACIKYAALIARGAVPGDPRPWIEAACRQGMPDACRMLQPQ